MNAPGAAARALRGPGRPGFFLHERFCDPGVGRAMLDEVIAIARDAAAGRAVSPAVVMPESQAGFSGRNAEDLVSKVFKLHRRGSFRAFLARDDVARILVEALGPDVDCFLSQFIFKNPGAWGQPWHQDSYYFDFDPPRPIVALWLAVTEATLANGCLHVLPGSQSEPVHAHVPDARPNASYGYVEIVDHDMSASRPCLLQPGDLLAFDSHLMHRSTDNASDGLRAAMVWHFSRPGTVDLGMDLGRGPRFKSPLNDWLPVVRGGAPVPVDEVA
ncbi:MAG: phytanoyl-CoA dioxygenase family protein [Myxococcales bacterium]|nr:phytanoyl-CoA dioxygenase family protein [Myxococcales bacterium]